MEIDVVVPAYNAAEFIETCLEGLYKAGFHHERVIVVDDGSTDNTAELCRAKGVEPVLMGRNTSAPEARNAGAFRGTAPIILFVDADVVVAPDCKRIVEEFFAANPGYSAVFGAYDATPAAPWRVSRIRNLLHRHVHLEGAGDAVTFWTGLGAVRRPDFEAIGGFDPNIQMMEDIDLGLRLSSKGQRIWLLPSLQGKHLKAWSLWGMIRTDLFYRAIPWTRLMTRPDNRTLPQTLNVGATGKISVAAVAVSALGLPIAIWSCAIGIAVILLAICVLGMANRRFLATLWREHSILDAVAALPVLWIHYFVGGLGYTWVKLGG